MPVGAPEGALVEPKGEQAGLESANREAQNALFSLPSKAWSIANSSLHDRPRAGLGLWGLGLCRCLPAAAAARRRHSCCPSSAAAPLLLLPPQPIPAPPHPAATAAPSSLCSLRKTGGKITGDIRVNGFPQQPATFNRVMGVSAAARRSCLAASATCSRLRRGLHAIDAVNSASVHHPPLCCSCRYAEQFDIHVAEATVREALMFSARLRLPSAVPASTVDCFVEEVWALGADGQGGDCRRA